MDNCLYYETIAERAAVGKADETSTKGGAALRRALKLLTLAGRHTQGIGVKELISASGLTRPTAYRMIAVLTEEGFLVQDGQHRTVALGPEFLRLAQQVWSDRDLRRTAETELSSLAHSSGGDALLLVRSGSMMTCVEAYAHGASASERVGTTTPMLQSLAGRAILAFGDWGAIDDELAALGQDDQQARATKADLAVIRSRFYAVADNNAAGVSVAAPVFDFSNRPIAAITLHLPTAADRPIAVHDLGAAVVQATQRISRMRGGYPFGIEVPGGLTAPDTATKLLVDARCLIGDSPSVDETGILTWIDILAPAIHRYDPKVARHDIHPGQEVIGAAVPTGRGFVIAEQTRLRVLDRDLNEIGRRPVTELPPGFRFNDGTVDGSGRLWFGAMDMAVSRGTGFLLRYETFAAAPVMLPGFSLPNGIGFSPCGTRMYVIDSMERQLSTFAYDPSTGEAELCDRVSLLDGEPGRPSGLAVTAEGTIFTCHWDGSAVVALSPDGKVCARHLVPVPRPSGLTVDTISGDVVVTSARVRMSEQDLSRFPASGSVYRLPIT